MRLSSISYSFVALMLLSLPIAAQSGAAQTDTLPKPHHPMQPGSPTMEHQPAAPSTSLTLTVSGQTSTLSLEQLKSMQHSSLTVHNGHSNKDETYSGVSLADLLASAGAPKQVHGKALSQYVLASGTDGYSVILSFAEIRPDFHSGDVIVADTMDGQPIGEDGRLKLIVSEDKHPARWVRNLHAIALIQAPTAR